MTAIVDLSDLINLSTDGNDGTPERLFFHKADRTPSAFISVYPGRYTSLWKAFGIPGTNGGTPSSSGAVPDVSTNGGLKQFDPAVEKQKWLLGGSVMASTRGSLVLYDRLFHRGGFSGTTTTAQAVEGIPTRYTTTESVGNQIWVEIDNAVGPSQRTITATYVNQAGDAATSGTAVIGATGDNEANRMIPVPLAAGDTGVREVTDITLSGSTGTAGGFNIVILRPLLVLPATTAGVAHNINLITGLPGIAEIKIGACLALKWFAGTSEAPRISGSIFMVEK